MFDLKSVKVDHLPQQVKFFEVSDGYFTVNEQMEVRMFVNRTPNQEKLNSIGAEIGEVERQIEKAEFKEELDELKYKLVSLESSFNYESETVRKQPFVCKFKEQEPYLLDQWKMYARDAKQNTVRSVAWATGWRSTNYEPVENEVLPSDWAWNYTGSKA